MSMTEKEMVRILKSRGYGIIPPDQYMIDMEDDFREIWSEVREFTMTSAERGYALYKAVRYIVENGIEGDLVECGVWKGGSCMLMARTLLLLGVTDRRIFLYDTFSGMTEPGGNDYIAWNGKPVLEKWEEDRRGEKDNFGSWAVGLESVRNNVLETGFPEEQLVFVPGPVENTLAETVPRAVSLLRLDTDWYESTKAELEILYPVLSENGVLVIDDYGHFTGARKAVDEYFGSGGAPYLGRIDYTGRIAIKRSAPAAVSAPE